MEQIEEKHSTRNCNICPLALVISDMAYLGSSLVSCWCAVDPTSQNRKVWTSMPVIAIISSGPFNVIAKGGHDVNGLYKEPVLGWICFSPLYWWMQ